MGKTRVSTTVDSDLLAEAREVFAGNTDSSLVEAALAAYLAAHRRSVIDAQYERAYSDHPFDEPDEWGDLASFIDAAGQS